MNRFWPALSVGGVMVFDELHKKKQWPGATRAVEDYLALLPGTAWKLHKDFRWWIQKLN